MSRENPTPPHGQTPAGGGKTPWRLIILLMVMTGIAPLSLNILVPAVPRLVTVFASNPATVQLTISLFLVGLATSQLLIGPLSDRFGRRPVVLAGLAIATIVCLVATTVSSIESLVLIRILQALGASTGIVIGRAIIRDLFERERAASMIGLVATAMTVSPMVAPLIGGVIDTAFGWQGIFLFTAAMAALLLVWAGFVLPETRTIPAGGRPPFWPEVGKLLTSPTFFGYSLGGALGSAPFFAMVGGTPHVVVTLMGRTSAEYGVWFAIASFGYMAGNFAVSRLSLRFGIDRMLRWGLYFEVAGAAISALLVLLVPDGGPAILFLPFILISFGNGVLLPNAIAGAVSVRPHAIGTASGVSGFIQMAIAASANQTSGFFMAGAASALPMVIGMLLLPIIGLVMVKLLTRPAAPTV